MAIKICLRRLSCAPCCTHKVLGPSVPESFGKAPHLTPARTHHHAPGGGADNKICESLRGSSFGVGKVALGPCNVHHLLRGWWCGGTNLHSNQDAPHQLHLRFHLHLLDARVSYAGQVWNKSVGTAPCSWFSQPNKLPAPIYLKILFIFAVKQLWRLLQLVFLGFFKKKLLQICFVNWENKLKQGIVKF